MALINYLARVQFDFGAIALLPDELAALNIRRPLLVSDRGLAAAGLVQRVVDTLAPGQIAAIFDETPSNPTERAIHAALDLYRNHDCDGIVALGGGSPIDLAKAVALLATHKGVLADFTVLSGGSERITPAVAPIIAIPTTAGTGAEVGRASVVVLDSGRKVVLVSLHLVPKVAICDPELTLALPPLMTAATGMDALSHCIETFLSSRPNPPAAAIALDGLGRCVRWIERATDHGSDREARSEMLMAALEGGLTFQKGLGAVHAMATPLGELGLHHGTLNAVLLPAVLRFNEPAAAEKYAAIRAAARLQDGADLAAWIAALNRRLGLPAGLGAMGVRRDQIGAIAAAAAKDHSGLTNPRPAAAGDYERLLAESL